MESEISDSISAMLVPSKGSKKFMKKRGCGIMKGYAVESGYMGYVNGTYMLFASETDYEDYMG